MKNIRTTGTIIFFLALATTLGCGRGFVPVDKDGESSNSSELPSPIPGQPNFAGVVLYQKHCAACHGEFSITSKKNRTSAQITDAIGAMIAMRPLSILTAQEVNEIALALSNTTQSPTPGSGLAASGDFSSPVVGTRDYVKSVLRDFFITDGTSAGDIEIQRIINSRIHANPGIFGGPCTNYDEVSRCDRQARAAGLTMSPGVSVVRKGLTSQACEEILVRQTVTSVRGVLSKLQLTEVARGDQTTFPKIFDIFYPGRTPNAEVMDALIELDNAARNSGLSDLNRWRHVLLPLCQSALAELI